GPVRISVLPPAIELSTVRDRQGVIVQAEYADGSTREATFQAKLTLDRPVAKVTAAVLAPLADGDAPLTAAYGGLTATAPVTVRRADRADELRFRTDVLPVLTRAGCNTGKCHGAASGKDGFRLSLFGYDPEGDYYRVTREMGGRRVNLAEPESCLLVNKATGKVPHTGGKPIEPGRGGYQLVVRW